MVVNVNFNFVLYLREPQTLKGGTLLLMKQLPLVSPINNLTHFVVIVSRKTRLNHWKNNLVCETFGKTTGKFWNENSSKLINFTQELLAWNWLLVKHEIFVGPTVKFNLVPIRSFKQSPQKCSSGGYQKGTCFNWVLESNSL